MAKSERVEKIIYYALGLAAFFAMFKSKKAGKAILSLIDYKAQYKIRMIDKALLVQKAYGIDPNLLITQAALESNWGRSELTAKYNNHFGMTGGSWVTKGFPVVDLPTSEYVNKPIDQVSYFATPGDIISKEAVTPTQTKIKVHRYFRRYGSMEESVDDWAKLISSYSGYKDAYTAAQRGDLGAFAIGMQKGGYATDPRYAKKVIEFGADVLALA